jgi:hypothetical protein
VQVVLISRKKRLGIKSNPFRSALQQKASLQQSNTTNLSSAACRGFQRGQEDSEAQSMFG